MVRANPSRERRRKIVASRSHWKRRCGTSSARMRVQTPRRTEEYASTAEARGLGVLIGAAGGAAALPGVLAASTALPVIGVPIAATPLGGMDALLSIVQMPKGVPVATVAIGAWGAANAAILAAQILAVGDAALRGRLAAYRQRLAAEVDERARRVADRLKSRA